MFGYVFREANSLGVILTHAVFYYSLILMSGE